VNEEMDTNSDDLRNTIHKVLAKEGFELVDFLVKGGKASKFIRVVVDHENGVSVDDCAHVSRTLSDMLDMEQDRWALESYRLEVSSPGIDRPLQEEKNFLKNVGRDVKIIYQSNGVVEKVEGTILGVDNGSVSIGMKERTVSLDVSSIREAKITVKWK
jgi:ribosome maturation factor RimP